MSEPMLELAYADPECGCPVEEWIVEGLNVQLHFEADATMEAFVDAGEWQTEVPLKATTMEQARDEAFAWVRALPTEAEYAASLNPAGDVE